MSSYEERLRRRFGGKIPDYLRKALGLRKRAQERREERALQAEEAKEREFQRKRALRGAPAHVWLVPVGTHGMEVHWQPPLSANLLPPTGYIVTGDSDSSRLLPPERRSQFLRLWKPGNVITVTADYSGHQITKLGEHALFSRTADDTLIASSEQGGEVRPSRRSHKPEIAGSNPAPATAEQDAPSESGPSAASGGGGSSPPSATFAITVAVRGTTAGFNRILGWGTIEGDDPFAQRVIHARRLRDFFVLGLRDSTPEDFPARIIAGGNFNTVELEAAGPPRQIQGGLRVDYQPTGHFPATVHDVFANGCRVRLDLYYEQDPA